MSPLPSPRRPSALASIAVLAAPILALAEPPLPPPVPPVPVLDAPRTSVTPRAAPDLIVEPDGASGPAAKTSPFAPATVRAPAAGSVLTAPVTLNANSSADAFTATQTGGGRAVTGLVNNDSNGLSAVKGQTSGSGAGVNGVNTGTSGNAGKFQSTNVSSGQPGLVSTNAGTGSALLAVMSSTANFDAPAIVGQHKGASGYGIGVEGEGAYIGVNAIGGNYGLKAFGTAYGVYSASGSLGVFGSSSSTSSGYGLYGTSSGSSGYGIYGYNTSSGYAGYFYGSNGVGLRAGTGNPSGSYAGIFDGPVYASGAMYAASYNSSSDRAVKQAFHDIDADDVLQRIEAMPIGGWDFQATPGIHHIGPMAQDFRAAFGLGIDDKHIDMTDGLGVSLAAIQALKRQVDAKEAANAELRARVATLEAQGGAAVVDALTARLAALEQAVQGQAVSPTAASR